MQLGDRHVSITLGLNGYVFVSPNSSAPQSCVSKPPFEQHYDVARAAAAVRVLVAFKASVDVNAVSAVVRTAEEADMHPQWMLRTAGLETLSLSHGSAHS